MRVESTGMNGKREISSIQGVTAGKHAPPRMHNARSNTRAVRGICARKCCVAGSFGARVERLVLSQNTKILAARATVSVYATDILHTCAANDAPVQCRWHCKIANSKSFECTLGAARAPKPKCLPQTDLIVCMCC